MKISFRTTVLSPALLLGVCASLSRIEQVSATPSPAALTNSMSDTDTQSTYFRVACLCDPGASVQCKYLDYGDWVALQGVSTYNAAECMWTCPRWSTGNPTFSQQITVDTSSGQSSIFLTNEEESASMAPAKCDDPTDAPTNTPTDAPTKSGACQEHINCGANEKCKKDQNMDTYCKKKKVDCKVRGTKKKKRWGCQNDKICEPVGNQKWAKCI